MRLLVNGSELELSQGTRLELSDKNIVFGFDDVTCQRTSNIAIPATPRNVRAFGLSNDWHSYGLLCRQKITAYLTEGMVQIAGYLYVSDYDHKSRVFNVCFVGGELSKLIAIRDGGSIAETLKDVSTATPTWTSLANSHAANESGLENNAYTCVRRYTGDPRPSSSVNVLLLRLANYYGVTIPQLSGSMARLRIENAEVSGIEPYSGTFVETASAVTTQAVNISGLAQSGSQVFSTDSTTYLKNTLGAASQVYTLMCVKVRTPVTITVSGLPSAFGHAFAFVKGGSDQAYAPTQAVTIYSDVINGGEYSFETGDIFTLVDNAYYESTSLHTGYDARAFQFSGVTFRIESSRDLAIGDAVRERDNLPDIAPIDLLKMCAALTGRVLTFDAASNAFAYTDPVASGDVTISDVTEVGKQERTVGDFARHNYVAFDHSDVNEYQTVSVDYPITNASLDEEKDVLTLPVSEGDGNVGGVVKVVSGSSPTAYLTNETSGSQYATKAGLTRNAALLSVFTASTQVTIEAPMTILVYSTLQPLSRILWRNTAWMWLEKQWKNGVCTLKLVKI